MLYIILFLIALAVGGVQVLLCFKAKSIALKLLPLCFIGLLLVCAALAYWFGLGSMPGDMLDGGKFLALVIMIMIGFVAAGDVLGWLVYALIRRQKSE